MTTPARPGTRHGRRRSPARCAPSRPGTEQPWCPRLKQKIARASTTLPLGLCTHRRFFLCTCTHAILPAERRLKEAAAAAAMLRTPPLLHPRLRTRIALADTFAEQRDPLASRIRAEGKVAALMDVDLSPCCCCSCCVKPPPRAERPQPRNGSRDAKSPRERARSAAVGGCGVRVASG